MRTIERTDRQQLDDLRHDGGEIATRLAHLRIHGYPIPDELAWQYEEYIDGTVAALEGIPDLTDTLAEYVIAARQRAAHTHSEETCDVCRGLEEMIDPLWWRSDDDHDNETDSLIWL